jgi:ADP-heptose:LPS heptosyltransferase
MPEAHISLIGLPWACEFVRRFDCYLDGFIEFPGAEGIPEAAYDRARTDAFFASTQQERFDLAIQLHGSGLYSNAFVAGIGARASAGFTLDGRDSADLARYCLYPDEGHEIHRLLALPRHFGLSGGDNLEFPLTEADRAGYAALARELGLSPGSYVCIHAGARDRRRHWQPTGFAAVADALAAMGLRILLTGSAEEHELVAEVAAFSAAQVEVLAGRTSLGALGCLIEDAALLISNDTGVSHIAAALKTPSVVLFSISDPKRWAPLDAQLHRALLMTDEDGFALKPRKVVDEAVQLLETTHE